MYNPNDKLLSFKEWLEVMASESGEFYRLSRKTKWEYYELYLERNKDKDR